MISVIIPTYKNVAQLVQNLKVNIPYLRDTEIIVVNDFPEESIRESLSHFQEITLIENKTNLGFAGAVNTGIAASKNAYIFLLNSDVILEDNSYHKAIKQLQDDEKIIAVSFCQKEKDGNLVGKNNIYWKNGFFQHKKSDDFASGINGWAEGGACIIDRKKYNEIGGFDTLYSPFYWEDIDLSYRAWKAGYSVYFNRDIVVEHHHESTIGKYFDRGRIYKTVYRNQFIFIWKNISDCKLLLSHALWTLRMLPVMLFKDSAFVVGLWYALMRLPAIISKRKHFQITDQEVLNKFL